MAKTLEQLLTLINDAEVCGNKNLIVENIVYDSREVAQGTLFVCLPGNKVDGHDYISQAKQAGAMAVLVEKDVNVAGVTVIKVPDTRLAMQKMVPFFFDFPARKLRMIGVTGTNGKTTTTYIIRSILLAAGYKVGVIGTIQTMVGDRVLSAKNTTPDVVELQSVLAEMVDSDIDYVVMEVSSHALSLGRIAGCEFDVGIFTNMTRDHLDFHGTFDNYLDAKVELFRLISRKDTHKERKTAVVNADDPAKEIILKNTNCKVITYGVQHPADLAASEIEVMAGGAAFTINGYFGSLRLGLKITGVFNIYNVLAAVGAALAEGIELSVIRTALEAFESVPGRFELVNAGQDFSVIVDYAHTPDGLENVLKTARQIAKKCMIVVFGCGGDRDRTKRPIMGKLAVEYGDIVIATSDNPRTEDPYAILDEIEAGILQSLPAHKQYEKITDRREAICRAISLAKTDDVVIITGKGHETYQILKDKTIAFDDREVARECIREMN